MTFNRVALAALLVAGAGMAGCTSTKEALGITKVVPDEFRVVSKAPLVVPPDYSLRPPAPGQPRPQELQPESQARIAILGQRAAESRSDGEKLLVARAGAEHADPLIRYVVDDEFGNVAHKEKSFADTVMFWRKGSPATAQQTAATSAQSGAAASTPLDPTIEAARIAKLTGSKAVVIQRQEGTKVKLPGL
jgi:hypothetical protein